MIRQMAGVGGAGAETTFWAEGRKHTSNESLARWLQCWTVDCQARRQEKPAGPGPGRVGVGGRTWTLLLERVSLASRKVTVVATWKDAWAGDQVVGLCEVQQGGS